MRKTANAFATMREHLGIIRSCALMMAHAQTTDLRSRYLKTLTQKIKQIDSLLHDVEKEKAAHASSARD